MAKGQFKIQKIMDVGTDNPIVRSLTTGLFDIVNMARISKEEKDTINAMNLKIVQHLTKAEGIALNICSSIENVVKKLNEEGVKTQSHDRCVDIPSTENLDEVCNFLKHGKQALQELIKLFNLFLRTNISGPRYDKAYKVICNAEGYGKDDPIALAVKQNNDTWLKKFVDLRNADEHPEDWIPKGQKLYYDFDINWSAKDRKWIISFPHFYEGTSIYELLKMSMHYIFTFVEEMNILFLQKKMPEIVQICKVPKKQQEKYNGRRFILGLKEPFRKGSFKNKESK